MSKYYRRALSAIKGTIIFHSLFSVTTAVGWVIALLAGPQKSITSELMGNLTGFNSLESLSSRMSPQQLLQNQLGDIHLTTIFLSGAVGVVSFFAYIMIWMNQRKISKAMIFETHFKSLVAMNAHVKIGSIFLLLVTVASILRYPFETMTGIDDLYHPVMILCSLTCAYLHHNGLNTLYRSLDLPASTKYTSESVELWLEQYGRP